MRPINERQYRYESEPILERQARYESETVPITETIYQSGPIDYRGIQAEVIKDYRAYQGVAKTLSPICYNKPPQVLNKPPCNEYKNATTKLRDLNNYIGNPCITQKENANNPECHQVLEEAFQTLLT